MSETETDLTDHEMTATLARLRSEITGQKVYAVDEQGRSAVYINGEIMRWAYIDDIEIIYSDVDAAKWSGILHGTMH